MVYIKEKQPISVGFYGYGVRALDALMEHRDFEVKYFWVPESRIDQDVLRAEKQYEGRLPMERIRNRKDLLEHVEKAGDVRCFLMNASPIILNEPILDCMEFYNIHPGSLADNRGHHPHLWSILLGEMQTEITLHSVTAEIDLGEVIETVKVPVLEADTEETLLNRAEDEIPGLLTTLAKYLRGECGAKGIIESGTYRRKVEFEDYRLIPESDTLADMDRKIRARSMHSGGFFAWEQKRYYVDRILGHEEAGGGSVAGAAGTPEPVGSPGAAGTPEPVGDGPVLTSGGGELVLKRGGQRICFHQSKITDMEGNVIWRAEG